MLTQVLASINLRHAAIVARLASNTISPGVPEHVLSNAIVSAQLVKSQNALSSLPREELLLGSWTTSIASIASYISNWVSAWEVWLLRYIHLHVVQRVLLRINIPATMITKELKFVWEFIGLVSWVLLTAHRRCLPTTYLTTEALLAIIIRRESLLTEA